MLTICPECGGAVSRGQHSIDMHIGRRTVSITGSFERCNGDCQEVYFAPGEMDATMKRASEAIRVEEGLLLPDEIKAFRKRVGLTQPQMEDLIGAGPKTVVRWEKGTVIQNGATDTLLRLLRDVPEALRHQLASKGIVTNVVPLVPKSRVVSYNYQATAEELSDVGEMQERADRAEQPPFPAVITEMLA